MTAQTWTSTKCGSTIQARAGIDLTAVVSTYEITEAVEEDDIFEMVKIPKGAVIHEIILGLDELDTNVSPTLTFNVGDDGSETRFISAATCGSASNISRISNMTGFGYQYTADNTIDVTAAAAPATGATSGTITLVVIYSMQDDV